MEAKKSHSNSNITLSIIMPCFNASDYLREAVQSVVNQNAGIPFEIIFINDGSDDDGKTLRIIEEFHAACSLDTESRPWSPSIQIVNLKKNGGLSNARNQGMKAAKGQFLTFVDADDTLHPNYFQMLGKYLNDNADADIFTFGARELHFNSNNKIVNEAEFIPQEGVAHQKQEIMKQAIDLESKTLLGYTWNKIYRTDFICKNSFEFENVHLVEDILFNAKAFSAASKIVNIPHALYNYTRRESADGGSITHKYLADYWDCFYMKVKALYDWYKREDALTDEARTVLANEYVRYAFSAVWRNRDSRSGMSAADQKKWIEDFYGLQLTKQLLDFATPEGRVAAKMAKTLQSRNVNKVLRTARIIDFVTNHMSGLLTHLRQSR